MSDDVESQEQQERRNTYRRGWNNALLWKLGLLAQVNPDLISDPAFDGDAYYFSTHPKLESEYLSLKLI